VNRKILDIPRWWELGCLLLVCWCCGAIMWPVWRAARPAKKSIACLSNIKQLALGQIMYSSDFDDRLPSATAWMDCIAKYVQSAGVFHCPALDGKDEYGYAMNVACDREKTTDEHEPESKVLLFESVLLARNACSGVYGLPNPSRHDDRNVAVYVDGHAKLFGPGKTP